MTAPDKLLEAIPGQEPSGAYLRYDPVYDEIKEARREEFQGAPDPNRPPKKADWPLVGKLTTAVLSERSKDLQIAAWFTEAKIHNNGIAGLRAGLELIVGLVERFWETIHPQLEEHDAQLRAAPLRWLELYLDLAIRSAPLTRGGLNSLDLDASRSTPTREQAESDPAKAEQREAAIEAGKCLPEDFEKQFKDTPKPWYKQLVADLDASLAALATLRGICAQRLDGKLESAEDLPSYMRLQDTVEAVRRAAAGLLARKLELEPDPVDVMAVAGEAGSGEAGPSGAAPLRLDTRDDAVRLIVAGVRFLRTESPTDPTPYLLLRMLRWGELQPGNGPVDPHLLVAPSMAVRKQLRSLYIDERWSELLPAAEDIVATPCGRAWLDLQRYVVMSCDAQGGEYERVADAIRAALRRVLMDIPDLPTLTLDDESAAASADTRAWLAESGIIGEADVADEFVARPVTKPARLAVSDGAIERLRSVDPQKAIEMLMRAAAQEKSERARFMRRSQASRIMVENGMDAVAVPVLREMVAQIDRHQLEDWEASDTVAQPIGLLYKSLVRLDQDASERDQLYLRVCRLDPLQAIGMTNRSGAAAEREEDGSAAG